MEFLSRYVLSASYCCQTLTLRRTRQQNGNVVPKTSTILVRVLDGQVSRALRLVSQKPFRNRFTIQFVTTRLNGSSECLASGEVDRIGLLVKISVPRKWFTSPGFSSLLGSLATDQFPKRQPVLKTQEVPRNISRCHWTVA